MKTATKIVRAGLPTPEQGSAFLPGPTFASAYHLKGEPSSSPFGYARQSNPTWSAFENALGELETGPSLVFASGMAAVMAVFGTTLRPGDIVVVQADCYYTTRLIASGYFSEIGIQVKLVPAKEIETNLVGAKLVWLETPSNPNLDVCDIARIATLAHAVGALVAVDNTTATALAQQPLSLGADFSVASDTKALCGHSDLVLGHVAVKDAGLLEKLRTWRTQTGSIAGPMEVWLAHRSMATLELRLSHQSGTAMQVAEFLQSHNSVQSVRYPGLVSDPSHALAAKQMRFFSTVISFVLDSKEKADAFFRHSVLFTEATSFGSVHSSAERRARWGGDVVPPGFIRMSVGLEDSQDLIADLTQALGKI